MSRPHSGQLYSNQFTNDANPDIHYRTTGPEIWEATGGQGDIFIAAMGTGGTITGAGRFLKEKEHDDWVMAVEPAGSPLLTKGYSGPHGLQGIGSNLIPEVLDANIYDEVVDVTEEQAYQAARLLARREGVLAGISSGAVLQAV